MKSSPTDYEENETNTKTLKISTNDSFAFSPNSSNL